MSNPSPLAASSFLPGVAPLQQWFSRLKVGQKIGLGYGIALGIAVTGTLSGVLLGNYYQQQAWELEEHARTEISLLHQLQTGILQVRTRQQQLIPLVDQPTAFQEEYVRLVNYAATAQKAWTDTYFFMLHEEHLESSHESEVPDFLQQNQNVPLIYLAQLEQLVRQIEQSRPESPEAIETARTSLLAFSVSPIALRLDHISDELTHHILVAYEENYASQAQAEQIAQRLRHQLVLVSITASVGLAIGFALLTSRAITRPLSTVTAVAKQATEDSNFELQAPVTTEDEVGVLADSLNQLIHRVNGLLEEQQAAAGQQLLQSEKMSSLGQMVAGVAHEINNPVNFIYGNLTHINGYLNDLFSLIHTYRTEVPHPPEAVVVKMAEIDLEFVEADLPKLLQSMQIGADRTRQIVLSLRNFSRLDDAVAHLVNLHDCIDSTLLILNNRLKKGVTVERSYGELPLIEGYAGSLFQVFMNLLSNAIDALEEQNADSKTITITSAQVDQNSVMIRIADNGPGIAVEHQDKIFETFFTTKPVGVGTGLGLSISREIVEIRHGGQLTCQSVLGEGTEFTITLPIHLIAKASDAPDSLTATGHLSGCTTATIP